jgi:hypothetical protein
LRDGFQFEHNCLLNQQINAKLADGFPTKRDGQRILLLDLQA